MQENASKLSRNKAKFACWLAMSKYNRIPSTQDRLANDLGLDPSTLTRWKKEPAVQAEVKRLVRASLATERGNIYGALIREATKGSFQHIKLALEILGDIGETQPQWKIEIVNLVQQNVISLEQVKEEFGEDLVAELFNATVATSG